MSGTASTESGLSIPQAEWPSPDVMADTGQQHGVILAMHIITALDYPTGTGENRGIRGAVARIYEELPGRTLDEQQAAAVITLGQWLIDTARKSAPGERAQNDGQ